jgi:nucleoside-diphosphate-sugar epimerase
MGLGLNLYSNIHVDDLAEAYALAHEKGTPGAVYHAVGGEANFRAVAEAVATPAPTATHSCRAPAGLRAATAMPAPMLPTRVRTCYSRLRGLRQEGQVQGG